MHPSPFYLLEFPQPPCLAVLLRLAGVEAFNLLPPLLGLPLLAPVFIPRHLPGTTTMRNTQFQTQEGKERAAVETLRTKCKTGGVEERKGQEVVRDKEAMGDGQEMSQGQKCGIKTHMQGSTHPIV